jgi:hypothetical protein
MKELEVTVFRATNGVVNVTCSEKDIPSYEIIDLLRHVVRSYDLERTMNDIAAIRKRQNTMSQEHP